MQGTSVTSPYPRSSGYLCVQDLEKSSNQMRSPQDLTASEVRYLLASIPPVEFVHHKSSQLCVRATPKAVPVYDDGRNVIVQVQDRYLAPQAYQYKIRADYDLQDGSGKSAEEYQKEYFEKLVQIASPSQYFTNFHRYKPQKPTRRAPMSEEYLQRIQYRREEEMRAWALYQYQQEEARRKYLNDLAKQTYQGEQNTDYTYKQPEDTASKYKEDKKAYKAEKTKSSKAYAEPQQTPKQNKFAKWLKK